MNQNEKLALVLGVGALWTYGMYKTYYLHKRIELLEQIMENVTCYIDADFQKEVDAHFEVIAENFDD